VEYPDKGFSMDIFLTDSNFVDAKEPSDLRVPAPSSPVKLEAAPVEPRAPRTSGVPEWLRNLGA